MTTGPCERRRPVKATASDGARERRARARSKTRASSSTSWAPQAVRQQSTVRKSPGATRSSPAAPVLRTTRAQAPTLADVSGRTSTTRTRATRFSRRRVVALALGVGPVAQEAPHARVLPAVVDEQRAQPARGRRRTSRRTAAPRPGGSDLEASGAPSGCHQATRQRALKGISEPGQGKRISSASSTGSGSARSTKAPVRPMSIRNASSVRTEETRVARRTKGIRSCCSTLSGGAGSRGGRRGRGHELFGTLAPAPPGCQRALTQLRTCV